MYGSVGDWHTRDCLVSNGRAELVSVGSACSASQPVLEHTDTQLVPPLGVSKRGVGREQHTHTHMALPFEGLAGVGASGLCTLQRWCCLMHPSVACLPLAQLAHVLGYSVIASAHRAQGHSLPMLSRRMRCERTFPGRVGDARFARHPSHHSARSPCALPPPPPPALCSYGWQGVGECFAIQVRRQHMAQWASAVPSATAR